MKVKTESTLKRTLKLKKAPKSTETPLKKAVKNVTEILKKKVKKEEIGVKKEEVEVKKEKKLQKQRNIIKIESSKKLNKVEKPVAKPKTEANAERGVVYVGHIPHGFYEEQMKKYFSQFGKVTDVRVSRSKKTGKSKGFGFVEFLHPEVAKIAAESMHNYLMFGRLVKTQYIPPEQQHGRYFHGGKWSVRTHPAHQNRMKAIKRINDPVPNKIHQVSIKKSVKNFTKLSQKLKAAGIDLNIKLGDVQI